MRFFLIDRVFQEEGLYVYNMNNLVEKHFSISIEPVKSWGGLLVFNKCYISNSGKNIWNWLVYIFIITCNFSKKNVFFFYITVDLLLKGWPVTHIKLLKYYNIRSTARHAIHMQFDIITNVLEIRAVQSPKCIFWRVVDCTYNCNA
jgi:hypothetical protein